MPAKTAKGKRVLLERGSKLLETVKEMVLLREKNAGGQVDTLLTDLHSITHVHSRKFSRGENVRPWDNHTHFEQLCKVSGSSLFMLGDKTKSHPLRLTIGRTFDNQLLDMVELDVSNYTKASMFKLPEFVTPCAVVSKPLIVFQGPRFENSQSAERIKSLLLDAFRGTTPSHLALPSIQHVIVLTSLSSETNQFTFRCYRLLLKNSSPAFNSGTDNSESKRELPLAELYEMGPRFDFSLTRERPADFSLFKQATLTKLKKSKDELKEGSNEKKNLKNKRNKNIKQNSLGQVVGRIHLGRQDYKALHTPHHDRVRKNTRGNNNVEVKKKTSQ